MSFNPVADGCRTRADWHDRKAAQLKSGDQKDAHVNASKSWRHAAVLSDKAERSGKKAEIFESAVLNGESAVKLVKDLRRMEFSESEIRELTETGGSEQHVRQLRAMNFSESEIAYLTKK